MCQNIMVFRKILFEILKKYTESGLDFGLSPVKRDINKYNIRSSVSSLTFINYWQSPQNII